MYAALLRSSKTRKAGIATVAVLAIAILLETVDFYRGWFPGYELVLFGTPLALAFCFYQSARDRIVAWLLLTGLAIASVILTIIGLWLFGP